MKTNDVIVSEVLSRANMITENRKLKSIKRKALCSMMFILCLSISLFRIIEIEISHHVPSHLTYGAVIYKNDSIAAYVSVGVLMFVIGVIFTIVCIKIKNKDKEIDS